MKLFKLTIAVFLLSLQFNSYAKHRVGNGGNSIAGHFTTIASNIATVWEEICASNKDYDSSCYSLYRFKKLLNTSSRDYVTVQSQDKVYGYDYNEREAINDGKSSINVSETRWIAMNTFSKKAYRRVKLVMHEYFTILGIDKSDNYDGSNRVMSIFSRNKYDIEKIASDELLPSRCSLKISGHFQTYLKDKLIEYLREKDYVVYENDEESRYTFDLTSKCYEKTFSNSCALIGEIEDNLKANAALQKEVVTDGRALSKQSKILFDLLYRLSTKIKTCSQF